MQLCNRADPSGIALLHYSVPCRPNPHADAAVTTTQSARPEVRPSARTVQRCFALYLTALQLSEFHHASLRQPRSAGTLGWDSTMWSGALVRYTNTKCRETISSRLDDS